MGGVLATLFEVRPGWLGLGLGPRIASFFISSAVGQQKI